MASKRLKVDSTNFLREINWPRVATIVGQKVNENSRDIALSFFERVENFRANQTDNKYHTINMDEMPMYFNSPSNRTFNLKGS